MSAYAKDRKYSALGDVAPKWYIGGGWENKMQWLEAIQPQGFDEYVGQSRIRQELETILAAASITGDRIPHILFTGEYGLGKTTLGRIAASDVGYTFVYGGDFSEDTENDEEIILIDEIHRVQDNTQLCAMLDEPEPPSFFGCTTDPHAHRPPRSQRAK